MCIDACVCGCVCVDACVSVRVCVGAWVWVHVCVGVCIGIKKYPRCRRIFSFVCKIICFVNYRYMIMTNDMYMNMKCG